ncbi:Gfo/Idh/MocA family oxidoreductase [Flavobacterium sp. '19STA2R22 D10 B1']|uniref:Gfo/Idh/MocA family oxidoreductase n=1 Tax=Flavobacterium aerium TaxID=3037261 RepID=UPI00278BBD39|nr:Gfo/Idh/MocA family oxidoreductase [Flavobacterium sp. '19STA2R22 D10 B1']
MKKIKVALLSYGVSGKIFHAPFIEQHPGFELTGSWERSKQLIQLDYPTIKSYKTIEELLADDVDLVIVNTPIATHFEYTKQVLLAGKHAVVEKAFTTTVAEAQELKRIAEEQGVLLSVFQNRRWDSDFKTVQNVLNRKVLGEIVEAEIHFDRYNPTLSPKQHKETKNAGAGIVMDLGSHIIDQALCLFGMPKAVFADFQILRLHSLVEDYFEILLYYPAFRVRLKATFFARATVPAYVIHGTKGSFLKKRGDVQEDDLKAGKKLSDHDWGVEPDSLAGFLHTEKDGVVIEQKISAIAGNYSGYYEQLYQSIANNQSLPVTVSEGIHVMQIIEAARESNATKKVIELA